MKWRVDKKTLFDYSQWHVWFAWKPVEFYGYKYWLCYLNRRANFNYQTMLEQQKETIESGKDFHWEYKETSVLPTRPPI